MTRGWVGGLRGPEPRRPRILRASGAQKIILASVDWATDVPRCPPIFSPGSPHFPISIQGQPGLIWRILMHSYQTVECMASVCIFFPHLAQAVCLSIHPPIRLAPPPPPPRLHTTTHSAPFRPGAGG